MKTMTIEFDYRKLRLAQHLSKRTLDTIGMRLLKENKNGIYSIPDVDTIAAHLNKLAKERKIKHFILKGESEDIILFDNNDIIEQLDIFEIEAKKITAIVKIQCYDKKATHKQNVPIEISKIEELYRIPDTTLNSGTCVYFLCRTGKVVYVGQGDNIYSRIIEHNKDKNFDDAFYIRVSANEMDKIETALINYLRPEYNIRKAKKIDNQKKAIAESILNGTNMKINEYFNQ